MPAYPPVSPVQGAGHLEAGVQTRRLEPTMGVGLAVTEDVRIQDREIRFIFGESLQKFLTVWLVATVAPGIVAALSVIAFGPIDATIELTDAASIYRGGALVLG